MKALVFFVALTTATFAFAQTTSDELAFNEAFLEAAKKNDTAAVTALTCLDGVSPEWKTRLEGSYSHPFPQFQKRDPETVTFTPFTGPQPQSIKYKDRFLVPNLPVSTICKFTWPTASEKGMQPGSTEIRLGQKDGRLMIVSLVPQRQD